MHVGRDQLLGCFALLFLTALVLLFSVPARTPREPSGLEVPYSTQTPGSIAVELTGESDRKGVYFIPKGTSLAVFLSMIGVEHAGSREALTQTPALTTAATVHVPASPSGVSVGPLPAEKRLALGIPIDINRSTREELVLVPGIGVKTADSILEHRDANGPFRALQDLMQVKGIKEKRLEKLRKYLCIRC
jgi:competence protein ComEA